MKIGFTTSVIGHALLLLWGLVALPSAKPFDVEAIDALPVELVPISDVTQIAEGSKTAPKRETPSQAKVTPPTPRPDSQKVGAAPKDQETPITEKATDTAAAKDATPPPPPKAEPKPAEKPPEPTPPKAEEPPPPKAEPTPPKAEPKPPETPDAPPPKADTGELAPKPDKPDKPAEQAADQPKPAPPAPSKLPMAKPKPDKPAEPVEDKPAETPPKKNGKPVPNTPTKPTDDKSEKFDPNEMAALLNKVAPSGGGAKASNQDASLGSPDRTGPVAQMSQSELDALTAAVQACFNPPVGAAGVEAMVVPLRVQFTPDGDLAGPPTIKAIPDGPAGRAVAEAAVRAVQRCAPYPFLPRDKYETWQVVNMNFSPPPSY